MQILEQLKEKADELGSMNLFNNGATAEEIEAFEKKVGIKLPELLKQFYMLYNGGCFGSDCCEEDLENPEARPDNEWNSNYFLTLDQIADTYLKPNKYAGFNFRELEKSSNRRLLPILHSDQQEVMVVDLTKADKTPIYDAFHEYGSVDQWGLLYKEFEDLLTEYISNDGTLEAEG